MDLVGAVGEASPAGVQVHVGEGRVGGVAERTVDLDRAVDDPVEGIGDEVLRHRHLALEVVAAIDLVGRVQDHQLGLVQLHGRVGDHPLHALLLRQQRAVGEAVQRSVDHHVERDLGLGDPAHAVRESGGAEPILAEQVALPSATEHLVVVDAQVLDEDLRVAGAAVHRPDLAHLVPPFGWDVDDERGVRGLGEVGVVLGATDQDREAGRVRPGDEPLVSVDHPLVTVGISPGLDERRVRSRHIGFGHREARAGEALTQRLQVLLLLPLGTPMQERVHVAFVGRLAVERVRPEARLGRLGLHHRELDVAETHPAPFLGHLREPDAPLLGFLAHRDDRLDQRRAVVLLDPFLERSDDGLDEGMHLGADLFELG